MKARILLVCVAALGLGSAMAADQLKPRQESTQKPVLVAQNMPVHHAVNNFGVWFWGVTAAIAVAECQAGTPYGGVCYYKGFW